MAILTVDEIRQHVTTSLGDTALQRLLDAAEEAIVARAGATGARTEIIGGGHRYITLAQPASAITSLTEKYLSDSTVLVADDYLLHPGSLVIERLTTGTNKRSTWYGNVTAVYTPVSTDATRKAVQIDLVQLALNHQPGVTEETIGEWTERYLANSSWNATAEADSILARLSTSPGMVVIG